MTRAKTERPKPRAGTSADAPGKKRRAESSMAAPAPVAKPRAISVIDDHLIEITELPEMTVLQVGVYEDPPDLASAMAAVVATGHVATAGASGRTGIEQIRSLITRDALDVVIVAIPGGEVLVDAALALAPMRPVIIAVCATPLVDAVVRAHATGADLVTVRAHDVDKLAPLLMAATRLLEERRIANNARGSEAVLRSRLDVITSGDAHGLQPFALFKRELELELKRARRYMYPLAVALFATDSSPVELPPGFAGSYARARATR